MISVEKRQLRFTIRVMRLMTADTRRRVFIHSLPARQEDMKVIVEIALLGDGLMALVTVHIVVRTRMHGGLPGLT